MTSRASALACLAVVASLGASGFGALGCGAEPVEARAIWVDQFGGEGHRRIHVYDRGALEQFEVLGEGGSVERVRLDPRGRGVLVRSGERNAAWFDLDDGRRLPLLLPGHQVGGERPSSVAFAEAALTWIDDELGGALVVIPLGPGLALTRREDGTLAPLIRGTSINWTVAAARAPIVFAADPEGQRASFFRYPTHGEQPLVIALDAEAEDLSLPATLEESRTCASSLDCSTLLSLEPSGELAIFSQSNDGPWTIVERRSPGSAGPLELPASLAEANASHNLRLLQVLDRAVSIWIGAGQLYHYDRSTAQVDSLPMFAAPPLFWTAAEHGRALILSSSSGPVYRADLDGLRAISVDTTLCANPSEPVVSPNGRWVAWTCTEYGEDFTVQSGVVVRVSAFGLERFVGVPMATLAIDDAGDLLLYSVDSSSDGLDVAGSTSVPRSLFSLSRDGVLTRIDELEPGPAPVLLGNELGAYIQGVALAGDPW